MSSAARRSAGLTHALCILAADNPVEAERAGELTRLWPALRFGIGLHPHQAGQFSGREAEVVPLVRSAIAVSFPKRGRLARSGLTITTTSRRKTCSRRSSGCRSVSRASWTCPSSSTPARRKTTRWPSCAKRAAARCAASCIALPARVGSRKRRSRSACTSPSPASSRFPKGANVREVAALVPADRLLCETDSPYLAPTPHRGKRNEPAWVVRVAEELSTLRSVPVDDLRDADQRQFCTRCFGRKLMHGNCLYVDTPSLNMVRSTGFEER